MIEGRSGGSGRGTRRELWAPPDRGSSTSGSQVVSCTDARPSPPTHFLPSAASSPLAPACWPRGKIPPHPSARSARHSSQQNGGPKGKMIEGRSGGSGRGTRGELWTPPDSGSAQPADRRLYRVPTLDPRRPLISFPPPLPHPRTCLLATGQNSAAPSARSARHSSPQNGGPKGKMIEGRSGGSGRGTRRELRTNE